MSSEGHNPSWRDLPRPEDVAAVRKLATDAGVFRPDEVEVAAELVEVALRDGPAAGYHFLFAPDEDAGPKAPPAGYVCYGEIPCTVKRFDLYWIVVDPAKRGRGLGRALMHAALEGMAARGGRRCFVSTSGTERYAPTRRFYERCGGQQAARVADYYDDGDDLVIYTWPCSSAARPARSD